MGIHYHHLVILLMIGFTSIAVVDRFTTNLFPMYLKHPQSPIFPDDWTATTFIVFAWVAGRELIVSSAFIYLLECKCLANWIFEHKPSWLIIDDIHISNKRLHFHIGWLAVGLPVIIHSYLVFLPLIKYPTNTLMLHHQWMRPIDNETGFYVENYKDHTVNIAINDLYALFVVTVCFMLLFPLSSNKTIRDKYYTLANYTHLLAAALYAIELLRTPFTIHCWFFCGPVIVLYISDRLYGIFWYRASNETKLVCKYNIDSDYVALFLHVPNLPKSNTYLGDVYWLNCKQYVQNKEFAHPFTTFYNHGHDDIGSFLFSSSMRCFPSHRGHRFPIRTAEEHQHVSYDQMKALQQPQVPPATLIVDIPSDFYLTRTDTAASGISVSGLAIQKLKLESSPSESVKIHALSMQKQQQLKLFKLSENRDHQRATRIYTMRVTSPSAAAYMEMAKDMMKYGSTANTAVTSEIATEEEYAETVEEAAAEEEEEEDERPKHHTHLKSAQTVVGAGSVSAFSLPAISYDHSEDETSFDIMERETEHDQDQDIDYKSIYTHHMQSSQCLSEDRSSTATFKGDHVLKLVKPKTFVTRTDIDSVINENIEVSYSQNIPHKDKNKKIQFGTLDVPKQMERIDDNLWIDEKAEEEFGWNVAVIMKVSQSHNGFTQYVADELGYNDMDTETQYKCDVKSNSNKTDHDNNSDPSYTNSFTDCGATHIYSYGPYRSAFGHIIEECFVNKNPIVLIGTGAGVSYIVDFLLYSRAQNIEEFETRVDIHFSCRSVKLFQWITDLICAPTVKKQHNLYFNAHLTNHKNINGYSDEALDEDKISLKASVGRMSYESVLRNAIVNTKVFFSGCGFIETQLIELCNELRFKMYRAHCF